MLIPAKCPLVGQVDADSNAEMKASPPAFNSQNTTAVQVILPRAPKPSKQCERRLSCPPLLVGCLCRPHAHDTSNKLFSHAGAVLWLPFVEPLSAILMVSVRSQNWGEAIAHTIVEVKDETLQIATLLCDSSHRGSHSCPDLTFPGTPRYPGC